MNAKTVEEILAVLANKLGQPTAEMMTELTKCYGGNVIGCFIGITALLIIIGIVDAKLAIKNAKEDSDGIAVCVIILSIAFCLTLLFEIGAFVNICAYIASPKGYVIAEILHHLN